MSDSYEIARFLEHLRQRGFDVTRLPARGAYRISRYEGQRVSSKMLLLDSRIFDEYFDAAYAHWYLSPGSIDRGEEILSLMVAEAMTTLTDAGGLELRRGASGSIAWCGFEEQSDDASA
jgi:hypothetical protein